MERIRQRISQREQRHKPKTGTKTRQNIEHNRFDRQMWGEIRSNEQVDEDITDLMTGDNHKGGERDGYDNAPELLQDLAYSLYKPDPKLTPKRRVEKNARLNRSIIEEVQNSPYYEELRDHTVLDDTCTTIALNTMAESVREIILRNQEAVQQSNQDKAESSEQMNNEGNRPPGCFPMPAKGQAGGDQDDDQGDDDQGDQQDGQDQGEQQDGQGQGGQPSQPQGQEQDDDADDQADGNQGDGDGEDPSGEQGDQGDQDLNDGRERDFDDDPDLDDEDEHEGERDDLDEDLSRAINQAMRDAADDVDELESLRKGIGLEDGEWRQMSPEQRLAMAERLRSPAMKEMAEMVGRMKRFAMGQQAQKVADVPHEPVDVEQGNELRHLLGSEYALLDDPDTEWEFYRRFVDRESLQYKLRGTENAGKGPIVACIDKSHSMSGQPFVWAMGVAEALRRICQDQERDYYAMFFGANRDRHRFEFPKGAANFERVMEFLSCQANGGTEFDGVLEEALARVTQQHEQGLEKADIVFITDGQAYLDEEWLRKFNEEKERVGCRVFGIYIGGAYDAMGGRFGGPTQVLEQFSDLVIPVSELRTDSVREVFAQV